MGAHTLGHPMEFNSMIRHYPWTRRFEVLDNRYYINIANSTNYRFQSPHKQLREQGIKFNDCNFPVSAFIGDEYGHPNDYAYKAKSERRTSSWGPWTWALFTHGCSREICAHIKATGDYPLNSCCHHLAICDGRDCNKKNDICDEGTCPQTWFQ